MKLTHMNGTNLSFLILNVLVFVLEKIKLDIDGDKISLGGDKI